MRSNILAFFRKNPVLLLVPAALAFLFLTWGSSRQFILDPDPEDWFDRQAEFSVQFGNSKLRLNGNGTWEIATPPVMSSYGMMPYVTQMPERGVGTWRVRGNELILSHQVDELGHPFDVGESRLSAHSGNLQLELPNGTIHLLAPIR